MFSILPLLVSLWFHGLFHSPDEVLFTFPSRYCFAIGHPRVFSLTRWSSQIHTGFHVPHVTRDSYQKRSAERIWPAKLALTFKKLQDSHLLWYRTQLFHKFHVFWIRDRSLLVNCIDRALDRFMSHNRFVVCKQSLLSYKTLGCSHFARRYSGNRFCFFFL